MYNTVEVAPQDHNYMFGSVWHARPSLQSVEMGQINGFIEDKLQGSSKVFEEKQHLDKLKRFGTFDGVVVHCLLTIWGIMLFLRLGWMVGHAGIWQSVLIILISLVTTIVTALSLSAICTNGEMGGGGTYFLVSRSLGAPWGASIGLIFALANAVAVALYVVGFAECIHHILKNEFGAVLTGSQVGDVRVLGVIVSMVLLALCLIGVDWVVKLDIWQLFLLLFSIFWFLLGTVSRAPDASFAFTGYSIETFLSNWSPEYAEYGGQQQNFLSVFAVFFPAMTGMMAGANMSGDLRDPQKSIPGGTIISVLLSSAVYIIVVCVLGAAFLRLGPADSHGLYLNQFVMADVSLFRPVIYAGILASTFSSALASMLGAPRILKAVCEDGLFEFMNFFAKGRAKDNEPVRGYWLAFFISVGFVMVGEINDLAPIITNFFLWNRVLINYACFAAATSRSPGWRPSFKYYHPLLSLLGALCCVVLMFALSWWSALVDMALAYLLFKYVEKYAPNVNWGDATQGSTYLRATESIVKLQMVPTHVKNWRPSYMIVAETEAERQSLLVLTDQLRKGLGLVFVGEVTIGSFESMMKKASKSRRTSFSDLFQAQREKKNDAAAAAAELTTSCPSAVKAPSVCYESIVASSFLNGVQTLLQTAGIGGLRPNVLLMKYPSADDQDTFVHIVHSAVRLHFGVGVLRGTVATPKPKGTIDIWWLADTGGLTLLLPHLLRQSHDWSHCRIRVFLHGVKGVFYEHEAAMVRLMKLFRIDVAHVEHVDLFQEPTNHSWRSFGHINAETSSAHRTKLSHYLRLGECLKERSDNASMVFVTLPYPRVKNFRPQEIVQWLEASSRDVQAPILFLRGNQQRVLTLKC